MEEHTRRMVGGVLIAMVSLTLLAGSIAKFAHPSGVVAKLGEIGFGGPWITRLAILEIVCGAMLAFGQTRPIGLLMVSGFFGGAIATHIQHGQPWALPAIILAMCWLGVWLRHPVILWTVDTGSVARVAP